MDKIWKPKNRNQRWIGTVVIWVVISGISQLFEKVELVNGILGIIAIGLTIYVWVAKSEYYDNSQDIEHNKRKQEAQQLNEERKSALGNVVASTTLRYYGGGTIPKEGDVFVAVTTTGLMYGREFIQMDKITSVNLETQSQIQSRITATRMLAFGIFALAAPKRKKSTEKYLAIEYSDGFSSTLILGGQNTTKIQAALIRAKRSAINGIETPVSAVKPANTFELKDFDSK